MLVPVINRLVRSITVADNSEFHDAHEICQALICINEQGIERVPSGKNILFPNGEIFVKTGTALPVVPVCGMNIQKSIFVKSAQLTKGKDGIFRISYNILTIPYKIIDDNIIHIPSVTESNQNIIIVDDEP